MWRGRDLPEVPTHFIVPVHTHVPEAHANAAARPCCMTQIIYRRLVDAVAYDAAVKKRDTPIQELVTVGRGGPNKQHGKTVDLPPFDVNPSHDATSFAFLVPTMVWAHRAVASGLFPCLASMLACMCAVHAPPFPGPHACMRACLNLQGPHARTCACLHACIRAAARHPVPFSTTLSSHESHLRALISIIQ